MGILFSGCVSKQHSNRLRSGSAEEYDDMLPISAGPSMICYMPHNVACRLLADLLRGPEVAQILVPEVAKIACSI